MKVGLSDYLLMLNSSSQAPNNFETEKLGARHTCESSGSCLGSPDGVVVQRTNARVVCAPSFVGSAAWSRFGAGGTVPIACPGKGPHGQTKALGSLHQAPRPHPIAGSLDSVLHFILETWSQVDLGLQKQAASDFTEVGKYTFIYKSRQVRVQVHPPKMTELLFWMS